MKGDFTRRTFRRRNHYRGVMLQQGRVGLDADWNEQVEIQAHHDRITARDTVGRQGAPADEPGMEIVCQHGDITRGGCVGADLRIGAGRYYVDGILCENEVDVPLAAQPDLPGPVVDQSDVPGETLPTNPGTYLAYLDVWFEHLSVAEQPSLREVALGGPDTATRTRTIWQVRLHPADGLTCCADLDASWTPHPPTTARLTAWAKLPGDDPGPCCVPTTAGFRRLENQLYRVEIHDGSDAPEGPNFVWSRENGSVASPLLAVADKTLTIAEPGRDKRLGFAKNDWIEVLELGQSRRGEPGVLGRLDEADGTRLVVAEWKGTPPRSSDKVTGTVVRRWDSAGAQSLSPGNALPLEDGVQIEFDGGTVGTGEYWEIPARTANLDGPTLDPNLAGDVDWPRDENSHHPIPQRPVGITHRYAPLALLELGYGRQWRRLEDCRTIFPSLGELDACHVRFAPGDCAALAGADTVQAAIDRLAAARSLVEVGGTGQVGRAGGDLPRPVEVLVRSDCGPVPGATVRFTVSTGAVRGALGAPGAATSWLDVTTGVDGMARCYWRLGPDPTVQALTAELQPGRAPVEQPTRLAFTASANRAAGLHVTRVALVAGGVELLNDTTITTDQLAGGLAVVLDGAPDRASIVGKPVLRVTLDLPFPASVSDRERWGDTVVGTMPVTLAGELAVDTVGKAPPGSAVVWTPSPAVAELLNRLFATIPEGEPKPAILGHLTLTGRAVVDPDGRAVNGLALGRRGENGTEWALPTVDDVPGADFIQWFWLEASL